MNCHRTSKFEKKYIKLKSQTMTKFTNKNSRSLEIRKQEYEQIRNGENVGFHVRKVWKLEN